MAEHGKHFWYEECIDYMFPEETQMTNLNILEAAYKWKKQKISNEELHDVLVALASEAIWEGHVQGF